MLIVFDGQALAFQAAGTGHYISSVNAASPIIQVVKNKYLKTADATRSREIPLPILGVLNEGNHGLCPHFLSL
jgi:hypothetical protein